MKTFLLFAFVIFAFCNLDAQQPGRLDTSYGVNGKIFTSANPVLKNMALQSDNKLLQADGSKDAFTVIRYLTNGDIDTDFGQEGVSTVTFPDYTSQGISSLQVLPDQSFYAFGHGVISNPYPNYDVLIAKFKPNGNLDSSFGINGRAIIDYETFDFVYGSFVSQDGKILLTGTIRDNSITSNRPLIIRCLPDGSPDDSFGINGKAELPDVFDLYYSNSIVAETNGRIVIAGRTGISKYNGFLVALTPNGIVDSSFGTNGIIKTNFTAIGEFFTALKLQHGDNIVAGGVSSSVALGAAQMLAARYDKDGNLDKSFGNGGFTLVKFNHDAVAYDMALQQNEKIVLAGTNNQTLRNSASFALARLTKDGVIDSSFGINGKQTTDFGAIDLAYAVVIQTDGKIIIDGEVDTDKGGIARYYGDPVKQLGPIAKKIRRWIRNHTLQWQPLNDNNIAYYSIQQSSNGVSGFKEIGRIAAVNRQSSNAYSYNLNSSTSNTQPSSNYYRVTAVSTTGDNIVSDVIADETVSSITISPDPVKDVMKISGLQANQKTVINIVDRNGSVLQSATAQSSSYNMNIAQLKSGVYNVVVTINNKTQSIKFMKE